MRHYTNVRTRPIRVTTPANPLTGSARTDYRDLRLPPLPPKERALYDANVQAALGFTYQDALEAFPHIREHNCTEGWENTND